MAVSQYLRPESLIDAVRNHFTPDVVHRASSLVGEPESSTRSALNAAVPSVLSGLVNTVSSREGADSVSALIRDGGYGAVTESASSLFSGGSATNNMMGAGQQLLGKIFGSKSSSVADLVAKSSGVSSASATKLLSLAAPLTLGVLGKGKSRARFRQPGKHASAWTIRDPRGCTRGIIPSAGCRIDRRTLGRYP